MAGSDVYGGFNWMQLAQQMAAEAAQQAYQRAMMEFQRQQATGYVQSGPYGNAPTREQALMGIWNGRKDIRDMYQQWWGADADPMQAMENWLSITTEPGVKQDPITYATQQGWIEPYAPGAMTPTLAREGQEGSLGLQYLELLNSQKGPQDWISYWNTTRNAAQTNLPAWANSLAQGLNMPAFQGPSIAPPGYGGQSTAGTQQAPGAVANTAGALPSWAQSLPGIAPQSVRPQQFTNMLPSERAGLQGLVENQGGYYQDFLQQMQNAWPTGSAGKGMMWG